MRPTGLLPAALVLPAFASQVLAAQAPTHLNVAPSQLVEVAFWRDATLSNVYVMGGLVRADGLSLGTAVPPGKMLVLREAFLSFSLGPRTYAPTVSFTLLRGYASGGGVYSYGARRTLHLKAAASSVSTEESLAFDLPSEMAFTDTYRPRLTISGPSSLVSNVQLFAAGYLVDLPASAPKAEAPDLLGE